jgi:hypothetical protein
MDLGKSTILICAAIAIVIVSSGCLFFTDQKNITEISLYGQDYKFSHNIVDSLKVSSNNQSGIKEIFDNCTSACVMFNGSSEVDNSYFAVVGYNVIWKLQAYYTNFNSPKIIYVCNETNDTSDVVIEFRGPNTGARETSVNLESNHIIVQGTSSINIEKAGDKLVLSIFGISKI